LEGESKCPSHAKHWRVKGPIAGYALDGERKGLSRAKPRREIGPVTDNALGAKNGHSREMPWRAKERARPAKPWRV